MSFVIGVRSGGARLSAARISSGSAVRWRATVVGTAAVRRIMIDGARDTLGACRLKSKALWDVVFLVLRIYILFYILFWRPRDRPITPPRATPQTGLI